MLATAKAELDDGSTTPERDQSVKVDVHPCGFALNEVNPTRGGAFHKAFV